MYCPYCDQTFEVYYIEFDEKDNLPKEKTLSCNYCPKCGQVNPEKVRI